MSRPGPPMDNPGEAELLKQFETQLAGMGPADMRELLDRLVGGVSGVDALEQPVPSRRRERRADVVTYRVRVDIAVGGEAKVRTALRKLGYAMGPAAEAVHHAEPDGTGRRVRGSGNPSPT